MTMKQQGLFLVIEGTDGSGKGTQFELLKNRLLSEGYDVVALDFPRYEEPSSYFVREYLNGRYGTAEEVGPYTGSLFYALDRYQAAPKIREALERGAIVLANRFTGSNMAHQGTKLHSPEERRGYFIWLDNLEFAMLKIPRPDRSIVLRVPAEIAQQLVDKKSTRSYTEKKRDLHEADLGHLKRSVEVYDDLTQLFPKDFVRIDCVRNDKLLDVDAVHKLLWETIQPLLPEVDHNVKKSISESATDNPYVMKTKQGYKITSAGEDFLKQAVTSVDKPVYAFTDHLSPVTIAAAMARLSRRGDDMRITILDEFATAAGKDEQLLQRVITAYGDDSVQQLIGIHLVVEKASNLLTKKLEWGRLAAYLEQSTRYIYFDQKDADGKYKYFVPELPKPLRLQYEAVMDQLFNLYSQMVRSLTYYVRTHSTVVESERDVAWLGATRAQACDAVRPVLPVAAQSTVGIFASGQALESLIMHLLGDELTEARQAGQAILDEARKVIPTFLERADKPERGGAMVAYRSNTRKTMKQLAEQYLPSNHSDHTHTPAQLISYWPKNELDLIPDMLYESTNLSLKELKDAVDGWSYAQKEQIFQAYMGERLNRRHKPGRAVEKAHYIWDLVSDYGIFRDLQRHRMVEDLVWQELTPRYGYEIPELVEKAGLTDQFEQCFELSLRLYSAIQEAGYMAEAQYATLLGHRMRWKITYNAREAFHLHELRTAPQGHPGYRKLVLEMHEKLCEVHPLLGQAMKFVNQDESPELTRLAAERYTQFKLQQLSAKTSD